MVFGAWPSLRRQGGRSTRWAAAPADQQSAGSSPRGRQRALDGVVYRDPPLQSASDGGLPSHALPPPPRARRHGRCLWHGQVGRRNRLHGCHAPRAGHEEHCARGHGRSAGYLRPHYCRHHLHRRCVRAGRGGRAGSWPKGDGGGRDAAACSVIMAVPRVLCSPRAERPHAPAASRSRCCRRRCPRAVNPATYTLFDGFAHLASGLSCGLAGLAAGMAIGIVGDAGVRCAGALLGSRDRAGAVACAPPCSPGPLLGLHPMLHVVLCLNMHPVCPACLQGQRPAAQAVRRHDPHPHFRRGAGPLRPDR